MEGNLEAETELGNSLASSLSCCCTDLLGKVQSGEQSLHKRADDFARGSWTDLFRKACDTSPRSRPIPEGQLSRVQRGQLSRARQELTGAQLAPRDWVNIGGMETHAATRANSGDRCRGPRFHSREGIAVGRQAIRRVFV